MGMCEIVVRQREIAAHSPILAPRIADNKVAVLVFVTDRQHSVPTPRFLVSPWHGRTTAALNLFGFEAVVHGEADDKWIPGSEANFHVQKLSL